LAEASRRETDDGSEAIQENAAPGDLSSEIFGASVRVSHAGTLSPGIGLPSRNNQRYF